MPAMWVGVAFAISLVDTRLATPLCMLCIMCAAVTQPPSADYLRRVATLLKEGSYRLFEQQLVLFS